MTLPEIAEKLNIHPDTLYKHRRGAAKISSRLAERLEDLTGISHSKWLYPEKYGDPWDYIDLSQGN